MAGQGVAGFAKTQMQCAEAAGLENPASEIQNISYNARDLLQIDAIGCVGVVDQLRSWGYDAIAAFQPESEEEPEEEHEESEKEHEEEHERGTDAGANRRERGGRRKKPAGANEDTEVDGDYRGSGFTFERYRELVTRGVCELKERIERGERKYTAATAVSEMLKSTEQFGISSRTLVRYHSEPESIPRRGGGAYFSPEFEVALADVIRWYRTMKLPVFVSDVIEMVREALEQAGVSDALKDGSVGKGFVQRFVERNGLGTGKIQPLEAKRAEWMTASNYKVVFDNWAKIAVERCGIAERNENYSPDTPQRTTWSLTWTWTAARPSTKPSWRCRRCIRRGARTTGLVPRERATTGPATAPSLRPRRLVCSGGSDPARFPPSSSSAEATPCTRAISSKMRTASPRRVSTR